MTLIRSLVARHRYTGAHRHSTAPGTAAQRMRWEL
jgi:hypothetical protein